MTIDQLRPAVFRVTLHGYELATLMAAARFVLEGADGEMTPEARRQLAQVVERFDAAFRQLDEG